MISNNISKNKPFLLGWAWASPTLRSWWRIFILIICYFVCFIKPLYIYTYTHIYICIVCNTVCSIKPWMNFNFLLTMLHMYEMDREEKCRREYMKAKWMQKSHLPASFLTHQIHSFSGPPYYYLILLLDYMYTHVSDHTF